jgi:hypothetical protein
MFRRSERLNWIKGLILIQALSLSGCQTTAPLPSGGVASIDGDLVFRATGFRFPTRVGSFARVGSRQYDAMGEDVSVKYQAGAVIVADVYEYPSHGKTLATEFADRKDEVRVEHSDARLLREGTAKIRPGGETHVGRRAVFAVSTNYRYNFPPPYQSELLVFQRGDRFIEYRFTYSAAHSERSEMEVRRFLDSLRWPGG